MKLECTLDNLKLIFSSYSQDWEIWRTNKSNNLTQEEIYVVDVYRLKNFETNIDDLIMFYATPNVIAPITHKLNVGLPTFLRWKNTKITIANAGCLEILDLIIERGGIFGSCAKGCRNDEKLAHQFIVECFAQCHNLAMIEYLGDDLTKKLIDYCIRTCPDRVNPLKIQFNRKLKYREGVIQR